MSSAEKGRIIYVADSKTENQIVSEFNLIYAAENQPEGMALFGHYTDLGIALSITPRSVPFSAKLPFPESWEEHIPTRKLGNGRWLAGDSGLR